MLTNCRRRFALWKRLVRESRKSVQVLLLLIFFPISINEQSFVLRFQIRKAYLQDLQMVQPILNQWQAYEPNLSQGLQAIGEAAMTCAEAQRKLVDCQKPSLSVVTGF